MSSTEAGRPEPNYPIRSVERALELLLTFRDARSVGVSEAAAQLGVARSTAHRLLSMLQHYDFIRQDAASKRYVVGPVLVQLGLSVVRTMDARERVRPVLEELVREVDETSHLQVLQGRLVFFLDGVESAQAVRASARTGAVLPASCTAGGKAVLATLADEELEALYPDDASVVTLTPASLVGRASLRAELAEIRRRGWARNDGESEEGLRAVAVALPAGLGVGGQRAAVTVAGPAFRMDDARVETIATTLTCLLRTLAEDLFRA